MLRTLHQASLHWQRSSHRNASTTASTSTTSRLNYDWIVSNVPLIQRNIQQRKVGGNPYKVLELHESYRNVLAKVEMRRRERNEWASKIPQLQDVAKAEAVTRAKALKNELQSLEIRLKQAKEALQAEALLLPNTTHPDVPIGPEDAAIEIGKFGTLPSFAKFEHGPKDHIELCRQHNFLDFEAGTTITGPKFAVLRGDLAMLELGLISWSMQELASRGFLPTLVPDLCRIDMIEACGFNPRGPESQIYGIEDDNLGLVGTAEIPLAGLEAGRVFQENELPSRVVGFSHAFRREAGARGAQSKGLYRLHQFSKVEMFVHCTMEQANKELEQLVDIQCDLLEQLGLHGRVLQMPTEELGASAHRKMDVEVWMPGRNEFGEVCSASDCTDYQSRRLNTQYYINTAKQSKSIADKNENGTASQRNNKKKKAKEFASTLNATAMAVPRVMLAMLETHQLPNGTIQVPDVMKKFLGGKDVIGGD